MCLYNLYTINEFMGKEYNEYFRCIYKILKSDIKA